MAQEEGQEHPLHEYLTTQLPPLGLDAETYLPYVTGYFEARQDDVAITDSTSTMMETDDDFDQVMELLQASSETHADDDAIWINLSNTIRTLYQTHLLELESKRKDELEEQRMEDKRNQLQEIELAKRHLVEMDQQKELRKEQEVGMDASKRALLEQYGYEDQLYDEEGNVIVQEESSGSGGGSKGKKKGEATGAASSSSEVPSNKAYAQQMNKERALESRSKQGSTKTEERQKSKSAKLDKIKKKEERRNRAQKGERKR